MNADNSESRNVIAALNPVAVALAHHVADYWPKVGWDPREWRVPVPHDSFDGACTGPGKVTFRCRHNGSHIHFNRINVVSPIPKENIIVGDLEATGPAKPLNATKRTMENDSSVPAKRTLGKRELLGSKEGSSTSIGRTIGASIASRLRQELGYGSKELYGIEGTTELEVTATASVEEAVNNSHFAEQWAEHEDTEGLEIEFAPRSHYRFERVASLRPSRQVTTLKGPLTYGMTIEFHGVDFFGWVSHEQMLANVRGIQMQDPKLHFKRDWLGVYKRFPVDTATHPLCQTVHAVIQEVLEFDHSTNVDSKIVECALDPQKRLADALAVVAEHGASPKLRKLAGAALKG